jgi:hypothetical protein
MLVAVAMVSVACQMESPNSRLSSDPMGLTSFDAMSLNVFTASRDTLIMKHW